MANIENKYGSTSQISNGVYVVKDGDSKWGGVLNHNFEILSQLNKMAHQYYLLMKQKVL